MHYAKTELAKVQFVLNLKIINLELKAQPSTPPEVKEKHKATIKDVVATVDVIVKNFITLFEKSLKLLTSLQEYPNLQRLETEDREL